MFILLLFIFIDVVLNIIILFLIPKVKFYKYNYLKKFFLSYEGEADYNDIKIIAEKLKSSIKLNQTVLAFSIILLILSVVIIIIILFYLESDKYQIKLSVIHCLNLILNSIRLCFLIMNWIITLIIISRINILKGKEDKIGFTDKIRNDIIITIIILSICIVYDISEYYIFYSRKYEMKFKRANKYILEFENKKLKKELTEKDKIINTLKSENESLKENKKMDEEQLKGDSERVDLNNGTKENGDSEIVNLKNRIKEKEKEIKRLEKQLNEYKETNEKLLLEKNEIENLKEENDNFKQYFKIGENEKLIRIIFHSTDQKIIDYVLICKNTDIFANIEQILYNKYPEYKDSENYFTSNGIKINKNRTLEDNKIKTNDIILLNKFDELS